ncbi:hypothetical protein ACFTWF_02865 [Rhodococcus sp. NPDC056960]|uniref:hypothetical protein n=1 Tax=Rhodococcus sp. NPDC056960 TaxID=3345982 RepID=UPI0036377D0F
MLRVDGRAPAWQQRIHAQLFHQGCPPITGLLTVAGRVGLARAELSVAGGGRRPSGAG